MAGLDGIINAADIPTGSKAAEWNSKDRKVYAYLFFLIKPNYHTPIIKVKSGQEAWKKFVAEYEKDSATMCMVLHQQFYSLMHNPAVGIMVFTDSWAHICTMLTLCEKSKEPKIELITSMLKQFEVNESLVAAPGPPVKVEQPELSLAKLALYMKSQGGGSKKGHGRKSEEFDWGIQRIGKGYIGDVVRRITW